MSDDSTAGWTPPNQPATPGGDMPAPSLPPVSPPIAGTSGWSSVPPPPPPPPGWSPAAPSEEPAGGGPIGERSTSSKKLLIGGVVAVLAVGAAGVFAVTQMSGGNEGGAASPEELGEAFMESLDQEDFLGAMDLLLPGERDTFKEPAQELVSELTRLEVLTDDAALDDLAGFDVTLDDRGVEVATTNVDDIANITMSADATATVNGEELPIGDLITDNLGADFDMGELTTEESGLDFQLPMTAVEEDGRWYLSYFYTLAEDSRGDLDIPETGIEPKGGESPEGAVDVFFAGMTDLDLTALVASLNPNEAQALQRYAPLFIGDAQSMLDEVPAELTVSDVEYSVEGSGSTRSVSIETITVEGKIEESGDSVTFSASYADGCITAEAQGETFDSCVIQTEGDDLDDMLGELDLDGLDEFRAEFEDILADYDQPGITVKEVDGEWYVSPIATYFDQFFAITNAIDREEIERAGEALENMFGQVEDSFNQGLDDMYGTIEDMPASTIPGDSMVVETIPDDDIITDDTLVDDTITDDTFPEDPEQDKADALYQECVALPTVEEAASCMQGHIDSGDMPDYYMPIGLRHPECGVGEITLGIVAEYEMSDEEYTAILVTANSCFTDLVAQGVLEDFEVPAEYLRPECAEGRNPWSFEAADNEEFFDRWLDCIYAE